MKNDVLSGLTVVDISQNLPGPYCSYLLQSMGAKVIKVEALKKPDPAKYLPAFYERINGAKEIITLDLKSPDDLASFYDLIKSADILIEGARPGVAKKLQVDFETLSNYKPGLIYCSISGYGQSSPKRDIPAHDLNLQAETGLLNILDDPITSKSVIPIADLTASQNALSAILAALYGRNTASDEELKSVYIDIAMDDKLGEMVDIWNTTKAAPERVNTQLDRVKALTILPGINPVRRLLLNRFVREPLSLLPHYDVFKCKDKRWLVLAIVDESHFWRELCHEFGGIFNKFQTLSMQQRMLFGPLLKLLIKRKLATNTRQYWLRKLHELPISAV